MSGRTDVTRGAGCDWSSFTVKLDAHVTVESSYRSAHISIGCGPLWAYYDVCYYTLAHMPPAAE